MNIDTTSGQERKHALFKPPQPLSAQLKPFDFQTAPFAKLISIGEVCEMLGVQRTFVNERVASGDLPNRSNSAPASAQPSALFSQRFKTTSHA